MKAFRGYYHRNFFLIKKNNTTTITRHQPLWVLRVLSSEVQQIDGLPKRIINVQRFEDRNARYFDPKDIMIQDYVVFLFESDLAFLGIITLILPPVILLTLFCRCNSCL